MNATPQRKVSEVLYCDPKTAAPPEATTIVAMIKGIRKIKPA